MFKRILVPLDQSALAEQALGRAAAIARNAQAQLELILVHQPFGFGGFDDAPWNVEISKEETAYLDAVAKEIESGAGVRTSFVFLEGDPVELISRYVSEKGVDLIVMTSHGRTGLSRTWLGSVADGVLRNARAPVLLLRPVEGRSRKDASRHLFRHILATIDESPISATILPAAAELAKVGDGRLTLLRVVRPVPLVLPEFGAPVIAPPIVPDENATKKLAEEVQEQLDAIARSVKVPGVSVSQHIVIDERVAQAILGFTAAHQVDAIAMTTHGRSGAARFFMGSVADKVLRGSELPLLIQRPPQAE